MKTGAAPSTAPATPMVRLAGEVQDAMPSETTGDDALRRARAFAEPLLAGQPLDTGEDALAHAHGVADVLQAIGAAPSMRAAAYLVYAGDYLQRPDEVVGKAFGESYAGLVSHTRALVQAQRAARTATLQSQQQTLQVERVRKMLLAFASDLRVVLLRLASRLQTLRWYAAQRRACPQTLARESLEVFASLASRLGIWQIKWELEDLAFRFLHGDEYHRVAALMDGKRVQREAAIEAARARLAAELASVGLVCEVQGRPKHLYSVWKKMQGKGLPFAQVYDLRALRVIVDDVAACYAALARVHELYAPVAGEFDDYIAKPKANGYQSLHTVVRGSDGAALEVQVRTRAMHEHAEHGVAAHWAYKEAGVRGYAGVSAAGQFEGRVAEARRAVLRQLLAWQRDVAESDTQRGQGLFDDHIYVFTPQAAVIELAAGATPVDFAYSLHTTVGHRCRGARVDGALVPLHTPLKNGQTVEIVTAKEGGPSRDWLNLELGFLKSHRARSKVRAWFNAQAQEQTIARGRELVEKLLQREGRTALKLDHLATQLGFARAEALFEAVGKDEYSLHQIENLLRPGAPPPSEDERLASRLNATDGAEAGRGGVLVVGVESLLTTLARCCRPAPPDAIGGFVTRGKGVAIHRSDCSNFRHMAERTPQRVIAVAWGKPRGDAAAPYAVDLLVEAEDRQGLLRDISELLAKEKMNVRAVQSRSLRDASGDTAWMTFTVDVGDTTRLPQVLALLQRLRGVRRARRR